MTDQVMKPNDPGRQVGGNHYGGTEWQHWDWVEWNGLGYHEGQISRYVLRWRKKDGVKDLDKAVHHLDKLIEQYHDARVRRRNRFTIRGSFETTKTIELLNIMQTPAEEGIIIYNLLIWSSDYNLLELRSAIIKLKERYLDQQTGSTGSSTAS